MKKLLSCAFNMDSGCVELKFNNGSMIAINCTAVENEVADNMCKRSELDYLIYNDSLAYANLVLNGTQRRISNLLLSTSLWTKARYTKHRIKNGL